MKTLFLLIAFQFGGHHTIAIHNVETEKQCQKMVNEPVWKKGNAELDIEKYQVQCVSEDDILTILDKLK